MRPLEVVIMAPVVSDVGHGSADIVVANACEPLGLQESGFSAAPVSGPGQSASVRRARLLAAAPSDVWS